jgi:hypothetical protein
MVYVVSVRKCGSESQPRNERLAEVAETERMAALSWAITVVCLGYPIINVGKGLVVCRWR